MDSVQLRGDIFAAVTFSNLVTAKIVGLSWLSWSDTFVVIGLYVLFSVIIKKLITKGEQVDEVIKEREEKETN